MPPKGGKLRLINPARIGGRNQKTAPPESQNLVVLFSVSACFLRSAHNLLNSKNKDNSQTQHSNRPKTKAPITKDGRASWLSGKRQQPVGGLLHASATAEWVT
jgi:hypothetical protein